MILFLILMLLCVPVEAAQKVGTFGVPNSEGRAPLEVDSDRKVTLQSDASLVMDGPVTGDLIVNGNIGVNVSSPTQRIDVSGTVKATKFKVEGFSSDPAIYADNDANTGLVFHGPDVIALHTGGADRLEVTASGNVGINTTAPRYRLEVDGGIYAGGTGGNTIIETDGSIYSYGAATVYEDMKFPAQALSAGATPADPCAVIGSTLRTLCFNGDATTESMELSAQFPHERRLNSLLHPHVHWGPSNTNAGNVKWQLEYSCANIDGTFPASSTISVIDASDTVAHKHQIVSLPEIDTSLYGQISSMCLMRIFRNPGDGSDTYGSDAELYEFDIHYEIDTMGSREEYLK
jgi:hypothetical protein